MFATAAASPLESASARFAAVAAAVLALALLLMPGTAATVLLSAQTAVFAGAALTGVGSRCAWVSGAVVTSLALASLAAGLMAGAFVLVSLAVISSVLQAAFGFCLADQLAARLRVTAAPSRPGAER